MKRYQIPLTLSLLLGVWAAVPPTTAHCESHLECIERQLNSALSHDGKLAPTHTASTSELGSATDSVTQRKPVSGMATYVAVPKKNCEFEAIFHKQRITSKDVSDMKRWNARLQSAAFETAEPYRSQRGFPAFVRDTSANVIVVIGHNKDGNFFLPDGKALSLADMASDCASQHKMGVFLSCESYRSLPDTGEHVGVDSVLTYDEAFSIQQGLQEYLKRQGQASYRDIARVIPELTRRAHGRTKAKVIVKYVVIGSTIGLVTYYVYTSDDRNRKRRRRMAVDQWPRKRQDKVARCSGLTMTWGALSPPYFGVCSTSNYCTQRAVPLNFPADPAMTLMRPS